MSADDEVKKLGQDEAAAASIVAGAYLALSRKLRPRVAALRAALRAGDAVRVVLARQAVLDVLQAGLPAVRATVVEASRRVSVLGATRGAQFAEALGAGEMLVADAAAAVAEAVPVGAVAKTSADSLARIVKLLENPDVTHQEVFAELKRGQLRDLMTIREAQMTAARTSAISMLGGADARWEWVCMFDGSTCGVCWALDGTIHTGLMSKTHPNCRCMPGDIDPDRLTGVERFAMQTPEVQDAALGPVKGELYRTGHITLVDIVGTNADGNYRTRRIDELVDAATEAHARSEVRRKALEAA